MTRRRSAVRALLITAAAASAVGFVVATIAYLVTATSNGDRAAAFWWDAWLGFSVVGGVLVLRRPEEPIGRLLTLIGFFALVTIVAAEYTVHDYGADHRDGPLGIVAGLVYTPAFAAAFACTGLTVLTFPSGHADTRLRRGGALLIRSGLVATTAGYLLRSRLQLSEGRWIDNPLHPAALGKIPELVIAVGVIALFVSGIASLASAIVTFRRSTGDERQQMRWFARSAVILPVMFVIAMLVSTVSEGASNWVVFVGLVGGMNALAVAIGVAVSRYRLYDIDRVASRTASYAVVTALVVSGYVGVVALTESVLGFSSSVAVAASTLAAAAAFQPVRRRVQRTIDRRFDRAAYDARRTVDAFAARLRDQVDVDAVRADLLATVSSSLAPAAVSVWSVP